MIQQEITAKRAAARSRTGAERGFARKNHANGFGIAINKSVAQAWRGAMPIVGAWHCHAHSHGKTVLTVLECI
jgi:hypothetical protein